MRLSHTTRRYHKNSRYFNDMNEVMFRQQVSRTSSLRVVKLWLATGNVQGTQTWVSAILTLKQQRDGMSESVAPDSLNASIHGGGD